jgi:hypothetical protein
MKWVLLTATVPTSCSAGDLEGAVGLGILVSGLQVRVGLG